MPSTPAGSRPSAHKRSPSSSRAMSPKRPAAPPKRSHSAPAPARAAAVSKAKPTAPRRADTQPPSSRHPTSSRHGSRHTTTTTTNSGTNIRTHHHSTSKHHHGQRSLPNGQIQYVTCCNRKHYDDGFYARCQRKLRQWVKWE